MLRRRTPDEYATGLSRILEDNRRVEALVAQMLQLASLEGARAGEAPAVDLRELATETLRQLEPLAEERGITLCLLPSPAMPVRLPREQGLILISNLVMNAIQHSSPGKEVSVELLQGDIGQVNLQVADRGCGISTEALPHIFERFFREDRSRSRDTGGTGLGLSICKSIVEAVGGRIAVNSTPGEGTTVSVIFRVA